METQSTPIPDRFNELLAYFKLDAFGFASAIGDQRSEKVKRILDGKGFPSFDMLLRIKKTFPDVNLNWLVRGTGHMITQSNKLGGANIVIKGNADSSYIPMVGVSRKKEYISNHEDPMWVVQEPSADYALYNDHTYRDFECGSHDMEPMFTPGDIVRGIWIQGPERMKIGRIFVVVTQDEIYIRRLSDSGKVLTLAPLDDSFPPIKVLNKDVLEAWQVVEVRKRTL